MVQERPHILWIKLISNRTSDNLEAIKPMLLNINKINNENSFNGKYAIINEESLSSNRSSF